MAIRARSFWFITVAGFLFAFTVYGILTRLVVYLLGVGYRPAVAAIVLSFTLGLNALGRFSLESSLTQNWRDILKFIGPGEKSIGFRSRRFPTPARESESWEIL